MRIANVNGRAGLVVGDGVIDIATVSDGRFGPDPMSVYERWDEFLEVAAGFTGGATPLDASTLGCPVPHPRQVFAIGLNYRSHAEESGMNVPAVPATFTKFPGASPGRSTTSRSPATSIDWEVELVGGHRPHGRPRRRGGRVVARRRPHGRSGHQRSHAAVRGRPRSSRSASRRRGFGPMGPWLVTLDEFSDPDDLALGCSVDGEMVQDATAPAT